MKPILFCNTLYKDERGYFIESFREKNFKIKFVQDNFSFSKKGVIRGLHYQLKRPKTKLLSVLKEKIFDVIVDVRKKSNKFGKIYTFLLDEKNNNQLLIPRGYAHGFQCLTSTALISYKCDNYYYANDQYGIKYNDKNLNIKWPVKENIVVSKKDQDLPILIKNLNLFK